MLLPAYLRRNGEVGFTLIEVMLAISLLSVMAYYAMEYTTSTVEKKQVEETVADIMAIANEAEQFYLGNGGKWPNQASAFGICTDQNGEDSVLKTAKNLSPFGSKYLISCNVSSMPAPADLMPEFYIKVNVAEHLADAVERWLPIASQESSSTAGEITVRSTLHAPRVPDQWFVDVKKSGEEIDKPNCHVGKVASIFASPRSVCVDTSVPDSYLRGYRTVIDESVSSKWKLSLKVYAMQEKTQLNPDGSVELDLNGNEVKKLENLPDQEITTGCDDNEILFNVLVACH